MRCLPVVGTAAADDVGRLLLLRRRDTGTWGIPGGRVEVGESWQDAAEREFREETGMSVVLTGLLGIYSDPAAQTHTYPTGESVQFVGVVFLGTAGRPVQPPDGEATELGYFASADLPSEIFEPDRPVISDFFRPEGRPVLA